MFGAFRNTKWGGLIGLPLFVCAVLVSAGARAEPSGNDGQGRRLVHVQVDTHGRYPFLIDTAASHTVIYRRLVGEVGLDAIPGRSTRVMTATGNREMGFYPIDRVTALGRMLTLGETIAMPDAASGPDAPYGILGVDFLRGHVLVMTGDAVTLLAEEDFMPHSDERYDWQKVRGRAVGRGSVAVDVSVAGVMMPAIVDTGAAATVLNRVAADALRENTSGAVEFNSTSLSAAAGRVRAEGLRADRLDIGPVSYRGRDLLAANLPVFATYGASRVPAMILGADIIFARPVAIDFANFDLYIGLEKAPAAHDE